MKIIIITVLIFIGFSLPAYAEHSRDIPIDIDINYTGLTSNDMIYATLPYTIWCTDNTDNPNGSFRVVVLDDRYQVIEGGSYNPNTGYTFIPTEPDEISDTIRFECQFNDGHGLSLRHTVVTNELTILPAPVIPITDKSNDGCVDCIPPTFGVTIEDVLVVVDGFQYNDVSVDVTGFHTEFPLINATTGESNTVKVKVYENTGVSNVIGVQFGIGVPEIGSPLNDAESLIEVYVINTEIEKTIQIDPNNLVYLQDIKTDVINCNGGTEHNECLEVTLNYIYTETPKNNVMAINTFDAHRNSQTNYLNDGVLVIGESLNDPLYQSTTVANGGAFYPQRAGSVMLTLIDYKTDLWQDEYGYMWSTNSYGPYIIDTVPQPPQTPDKPSKWSGYNDRLHSEFAEYKKLQVEQAQETLKNIK